MRKYIYADESGNFDFSLRPDASRMFVLTTALIEDHSIETDLLELRRDLAWGGLDLGFKGFHATNDTRYVRRRVFDVLSGHDFIVDATILEKRKADPEIRPTDSRFYQYAWFYHMRGVAPMTASGSDELMVAASSIGTGRRRREFFNAVKDVMEQTSRATINVPVMWPAESTPCLQVADYCSWAIFRKWEYADVSWYNSIRDKIRTEFDLFRMEKRHFY